MSESKNPPFSLEKTRAIASDEVESARILLREGLVEESKKLLYRILTRKPDYKPAQQVLQEIQSLELKDLFRETHTPTPSTSQSGIEDTDSLIEALDRDLGLNLNDEIQIKKEIWKVPDQDSKSFTPRMRFDLAVGFFEMGCYHDALRELQAAEKTIRIEQTFLGELGVAVAALIAQCMLLLDRGFDARSYLEPLMLEPDLSHEDKLSLYYVMGLIESELGNSLNAFGWFKKIADADPNFRDVNVRMRQLKK